MAENLTTIVVEVLKNAGKSMTAREIAEWIVENKKDFCEEKIKRSSKKTQEELLRQLAREIGARFLDGVLQPLSRTADRPKRYYYDDKSTDSADLACAGRKNKQEEKVLYPKLAEYCKTLGIKTLRIDEKTSNNNGGKNYNIWLHTDVVGYKDLAEKFNKETKECLIQYSSERSYLYAFEVKDGIINTSNIRANFFQTVSNSSWANYSYLVAEGIEEKAKEELQLLCASFNIGFIQLNREEPEESDIVIQAPKTDLDWNMINRIAEANSDFRQYLKNISLTYKRHSNPDIQPAKWDLN